MNGCGSIEHSKAVERGDVPWYIVTVTFHDTEIQEGEMKVYKLLRQANSTEGQREGLKANKQWGEGHGEIKRKNHGSIMTHARITWDESDPDTCISQVNAVYLDQKGGFMFSVESKKTDSCEKPEIESPYFSGRIQTEERIWRTIDFQFRRGGGR